MEHGEQLPWGARIERGTITRIAVGEQYLYTIESIDRPGVTAYGIPAMNNSLYAADSQVCFFLFEDGTGMIIA